MWRGYLYVQHRITRSDVSISLEKLLVFIKINFFIINEIIVNANYNVSMYRRQSK